MHELQLTQVAEPRPARASAKAVPVNMAEFELQSFIDAVTDFFGPEKAKFLTEIWLDELASMDRMPGPTSPDWHLVSLAASARLATYLIDLHHRYAF